jgi:cell division protein FtsZ
MPAKSSRNVSVPPSRAEAQLTARICVVGVGGSGGSAINRMIQAKIRGVEFIAINTDSQALAQSQAQNRIQIGTRTTRGLGAGMDPSKGREAAIEDAEVIRETLSGSDMVFITCGMGGGTGSGAAPVVAEIARDLGALTVAVVTRPFMFEGPQRRRIAEDALAEISDRVDSVIVIPNDKIFSIIEKNTPILDGFKIIDDVLRQGVQGISEMITVPGIINVDFADVRTIMSNSGSAIMGIGQAGGENRALEAAQSAISSPLLEQSMEGARGILYVISGSQNVTAFETNEIAQAIKASADPNASIIFGLTIDPTLGEDIRVTLVATGFNSSMQSNLKRQVIIPSVTKLSHTPEVSPQLSQSSTQETQKESPASRVPTVSSMQTNDVPLFMKRITSKVEETNDPTDELDIPAFLRRKKDNP